MNTISIHALHYRVRFSIIYRITYMRHFNPRTPLQSAIEYGSNLLSVTRISIHALHYRVRSQSTGVTIDADDFNPRTPLQSAISRRPIYSSSLCNFNPRTPLQSAIGDDPALCRWYRYFNPRTPLQSAIVGNGHGWAMGGISIHALHYRVRLGKLFADVTKAIFQSTHSITECDSHTGLKYRKQYIFQSTHSITECDLQILV